MQPYSLERRVNLPPNASPRLVEDMKIYSAFVEMQSKMSGPSHWYQKLC